MIENLYVPEDRKQRTTQDSSLGGPARYSLVYTDQPLEAPFSIDTVASHYSSASDESAIEHPQPRNAASGKNKNHGISAAITSASSFVGCSVWSRLNKQQLNISIFRWGITCTPSAAMQCTAFLERSLSILFFHSTEP